MLHHNYGLSLPQYCKPNKPLLRVASDKVLKHSIRKMAKTSTVWDPWWQRWDVKINPLNPTWDQYRATSRKHLAARKNKGWKNAASHCSSSLLFPPAGIFHSRPERASLLPPPPQALFGFQVDNSERPVEHPGAFVLLLNNLLRWLP